VIYYDGALATGFPQAAHLARIATVASAIFCAFDLQSARYSNEVE
jgi:hypothetical protein